MSIYRNTIWLSLRHLVNVLSSLIIVRVLLLGLGENGYALIALIMGITASMSFLKDAFSGILQRYYAISIGTSRFEKDLYTTLVYLILFLGIILLIGYSFFHFYLVERLIEGYGSTHNFNLFVSCVLLNFIFQFLSSIPIAITIAKEEMAILFHVSIIESILKLILGIYLWQYSSSVIDNYFLGIVIINVVILIFMMASIRVLLLKLDWSRFSTNKQVLRRFASYINWSLLGEGSNKIKDQSVIYIFERFFLSSAVAARAISYQIAWSIAGIPFAFTSSLMPNLIKVYHGGDLTEIKEKLNKSLMVLLKLFLLLIFAMVIMLEDFLVIWLPVIPENSVEMTFLTVIEIFFLSLSAPLMALINASGEIRNVNVFQSVLFLCICITFFFTAKIGFDWFLIFIVSAVASLINLIYRGYFLFKLTTINILTEIRLSRDLVNIIVGCSLGLLLLSIINAEMFINVMVSSLIVTVLFYKYIYRWI